MKAKLIMFGLIVVGISLVWDSFGLPYNYVVGSIGLLIIIFGLFSKKQVE